MAQDSVPSTIACPKCGVHLRLTVSNGNGQPPQPALPQPVSTRNVVAPSRPASQLDNPVQRAESRMQVGALLFQIDDRRLDAYERPFIEKTREQFKRYGGRTRLTDRQLGFLEKIARKYAVA